MSQGPESSLVTWSVPQCPFQIEYSARVLDDIRLAIIDAFFSLPRGGAEIGGVLLGRYTGGRLSISGYQPLECEHAFGPSFTLSERDLARLQELLATAQAQPAGWQPVGWYHSHTRSEIFLTEADRDIHDRYFGQPWQVALVLKPHTFQPTRAGFFFREPDGHIQAEKSYQEVLLNALPLVPVASARGADPPAGPPASEARRSTITLEAVVPAPVPPPGRAAPVPVPPPAAPMPPPTKTVVPPPAAAAVPPPRTVMPPPVAGTPPARSVVPPPTAAVGPPLAPALPPLAVATPPAKTVVPPTAAAAPPPAPALPPLAVVTPPLKTVVPPPTAAAAPPLAVVAPPPKPATPPPAATAAPPAAPVTPPKSLVTPPSAVPAPPPKPISPPPASIAAPPTPVPPPPVAAAPSAPSAVIAFPSPMKEATADTDEALPRFLAVETPPARPFWPRFGLWLGLAALAGCGYLTRGLWWDGIAGGVEALMGRSRPAALGLRMQDDNGQLQIHWDAQSAALHKPKGARLIISDGTRLRAIPLDTAHLSSGIYTYGRQTERVEVTLSITESNGQPVSERTGFLGNPVTVPDSEAGRQHDQLQDQNQQLKTDLQKERERSRKLEKENHYLRDQLERELRLKRLEKQMSPDK